MFIPVSETGKNVRIYIRPFQHLKKYCSLGEDDIGRYMMFGYVYQRNSAPKGEFPSNLAYNYYWILKKG